MKNINKMLAVLLSLCLLTAIPFHIAATDEPEIVTFYYRHGFEVIVEVNNDLSYEQMKQIADHLAGEEIENSCEQIMLNPQCAAGNHDITTTIAYTYDHNVYTTSPKCVEKKYLVSTCTRIGCFYTMQELKETNRISTCHG